MYKPLSFLFLSLFFISLFSSCSIQSGKNRIVFLTMASAPQEVMYKQIVKDFQKKYPQYKVTLITTGWSGYDQKVYGMFSGGQAPDLFYCPNYYSYVLTDSLRGLEDYIGSDPEFSWNDFFDQAKKLVDVDGKIYGLPESVDARVFYVNKEMFQKNNLEIPYDGWTIQEFQKTVRAMTRKSPENPAENEYGFGFEPAIDRVLPYIHSAGIRIEKDGKFVFNTPKIREVLKILVDLRIVDEAMPSLETILQSGVPFFTGQVGMMYHGRYLVPELIANSTIDWDVVPLPVINEPAGMMDGKIFSIAKTAKNPDGAWKLLRYMIFEEGADTLVSFGDIVPPLKSKAYSDAYLKWGGDRGIHNEVFINQILTSHLWPFSREKNRAKAQDRLNEKIWLMFMGNISIEQACKQAEEEVIKALAE